MNYERDRGEGEKKKRFKNMSGDKDVRESKRRRSGL